MYLNLKLKVFWLATFFLVSTFSIGTSEKIRYDNFRVFSIPVENEEKLNLFRTISNFSDGYQFWNGPSMVGINVDIMVPPEKLEEFNEITKENKLNSYLKIENVQELIDRESAPSSKLDATPGFNWTSYQTLNEINNWLDSMASEFSSVASIVIGGSTHEKRQIKGIKIEFDKNNPSIFIEANIHAREWITSATCTWIINEILRAENKGILGKYNWYIFPIVNPDGFEYTKTTDRLWRKTRKRSLLCYGADPNRNWAFKFMQGGASNNPCSDLYAGSEPFSEIEMKTLSDYIKTVPNKLIYLSFHSYTQLLMYPFGHTTENLANYQEADEVAAKAVKKLAERYGTVYRYGNIAKTIYIASGSSIDWVKAELGTRFAYTYEFRDLGKYGFVLPPEQIIPNSEEVFDSLKVILEEALKY